MRFSIILPCYNEEESLPHVLEQMPKQAFEVIVVDNNSSDNTAEVARKNGAKVVLEKTQGYGAAIRRGFKEAKGDVLVVLDGDGQYPAEKIVEMVAYLEKNNVDFISGARFPLEDKQSLPPVRRIGNWLFTFATNVLFGCGLKDSQSGMWVFRRSVLQKMNLVSNNMALSEEIKIKALVHPGIVFEEFHIPYYERIGISKLFPLKHGVLNLLFLFWLRLELWKNAVKKESATFWLVLVGVVLGYLILAFQHIRDPFIHVTADVNGQNGMAVINLLKFGFFDLKFGVYDKMLLDASSAFGSFYTHHPSFFVLPTAFFYKFFGVSELTTRLGPLSLMVVSIVLFAVALRKLFKNIWSPLLITALFVFLPGTVFYGKTFELAVFSLPCALITFSLFLFHVRSGKNIHLALFFASVIVGGFMGWFYYFMPASIWFIIFLLRKDTHIAHRKTYLVGIPLLLATVFAGNFLHFYLLNHISPHDISDAFGTRTERQPFMPWLMRIYSMLKLQTTGLLLMGALAGLFVSFLNKKKEKQTLLLLLPLLLMPLGVFIIFTQWSTHPFGVIFLLPAIAVLCGIFLAWIIKKTAWVGGVITLLFLAFGLHQSLANLDFFYKKFRILGEKDIQLLKEIKPLLGHHSQVCLGHNEMGLGFRGIADWYLEKKTEVAPGCLKDERTGVVLIFHPTLGERYGEEMQSFEKEGYVMRGCAQYWCVMDRDNALRLADQNK